MKCHICKKEIVLGSYVLAAKVGIVHENCYRIQDLKKRNREIHSLLSFIPKKISVKISRHTLENYKKQSRVFPFLLVVRLKTTTNICYDLWGFQTRKKLVESCKASIGENAWKPYILFHKGKRIRIKVKVSVKVKIGGAA